jgi:Spy/CpxP family protein refolding chaperone
MRTWNGIVVFCAALFVGAGLVAALPGADAGPRRDRPHGEGILAAALDLTDEQRDKMRSIRERYREGSLGDYESEAEETRREARALVRDATATEQQVLDAVRRASAAAERAALERHRMHLELDSVLTDDQRRELAEIRSELGPPDGPRHRHPRRR